MDLIWVSLYVPKDKNLWGQIIGLHHDSQTTGHPGQYKTIELVTHNYWWPGVSRDVKAYVKGCKKCQATKIHHTKPTGPLNPHDVPSEPWEVVSTDLIRQLPEAGGYDTISVFSDHFSKWLRLIPTHMSCTSEGMACIYQDKIFPIHGLPQKFIHDWGPQYHSHFMKELYCLLGIKGNFTMAYHPQLTVRQNTLIKR